MKENKKTYWKGLEQLSNESPKVNFPNFHPQQMKTEVLPEEIFLK